GVGRGAAIQNAGGRQAADPIGPGRPPLRAFAARLVQLEHAVRHGEAEIQRVIAQPTPLATGLGVPASSCAALRKNEPTSRKAANPMPRTNGSLAVNTTW